MLLCSICILEFNQQKSQLFGFSEFSAFDFLAQHPHRSSSFFSLATLSKVSISYAVAGPPRSRLLKFGIPKNRSAPLLKDIESLMLGLGETYAMVF